ncbi:MAG: flavin reductase family protein [Clostridia bacterium]|nr:flavin reductase family protein [Clostridia bacterium]
MRKNFGAMSALYPMPVLIVAAWGSDGTANAMNAAWGGISEENEISICISADHMTTENLVARGAFTVSMATAQTVAQCDYLGIVSGNNVPDKLERCGMHAERAGCVDAPVIRELPMALECRVKSYDPESCRLVGEIVNISADESILTDGKIDPIKLRPITYDPISHGYYVLGEMVGRAFSDGTTISDR